MMYDSLKGLKPEDYQHEGEKLAMGVLKKIPLFDKVITKYIDALVKFDIYSEAVSEYFRITERTNPRVYRLYQKALMRLDMPEEYPLFSKLSYSYNAFAAGYKTPIITLHSSCIANYSDGELLALMGHEIGHIKSGHCVYQNMAYQLNSILASLGGVAESVAYALQFAIMEWGRNSEYTADRAGLIACADIEAYQMSMLKLLGHSPNLKDIDFSIEHALKQAEDLKAETDDPVGKIMFVLNTLTNTHPWSILRIKQMDDWYNYGGYEKLIAKFS